MSIAQLNNPYLRACIHPNVRLYSPFTMRWVILPEVYKEMHLEIERKLQNCNWCTLIPDRWTGPFRQTEFLGLACQLINSSFEREIIILGMEVMNNGHSAEEVKKAIENIVNKYNFDKNNCKGKYKLQ